SPRASQHFREGFVAAQLFNPSLSLFEHHQVRDQPDQQDGSGTLLLGHRSDAPYGDQGDHLQTVDRALHQAYGFERNSAGMGHGQGYLPVSRLAGADFDERESQGCDLGASVSALPDG